MTSLSANSTLHKREGEEREDGRPSDISTCLCKKSHYRISDRLIFEGIENQIYIPQWRKHEFHFSQNKPLLLGHIFPYIPHDSRKFSETNEIAVLHGGAERSRNSNLAVQFGPAICIHF